MANRARIRLFVAIVAVLSVLVTLIWALSKRRQPEQAAIVTTVPSAEASPIVSPIAEPTLASPSPLPSVESTIEEASPTPLPPPTENRPQPASTIQTSPGLLPPLSAQLLIPVAGVRPEQLRDTFKESRSEGRAHDAIDIAAPRGTPVLAVADGRIIKLFQSVPGGTTLYQLAPDNRTVYHYAHLDRYADGIAEGRMVRRGEVIAYVGDTGNAGAGNYHLHFSILLVLDPKRYWDGVNINPYPLLRGATP
jgi:murein DD-endopeptidase MepM/ murein hydrolase activator NlpD